MQAHASVVIDPSMAHDNAPYATFLRRFFQKATVSPFPRAILQLLYTLGTREEMRQRVS